MAFSAGPRERCPARSKSELRHAAADVQLLYEVGRDLANSRDWPAWKPGDEFEGARNASASARQ